MQEAFVFDVNDGKQYHAATIQDVEDGLLLACFAGPREGSQKTGIWGAEYRDGRWGNQRLLVDPLQPSGRRYPLWNPVFSRSGDGRILLYYQVGPSPSRWWGAYIESVDEGATWSQPRLLDSGRIGPVRGRPVVLPSGVMLIPTSTENEAWRICFERSEDRGEAWSAHGPRASSLSAIQPVLLIHGQAIQSLCRTTEGFLGECWSFDEGLSWTDLRLTQIPAPDAAIDVVRANDGQFLLLHNSGAAGRAVLIMSASTDGEQWRPVHVLENGEGEFSYPSACVTRCGDLHIAYTWRRETIKHVSFTAEELRGLLDAV
ncbi:exo-alpha-sialidase [Hahella sp. CR1]|uniref:sialidase family protein n=1 Tax=Hahella sp. CR1 TaxID=2992807 RepID=UPI00244244B9|nr:exo-alpha-sialidase [Hahella sp. CR1]MDG9670070.1 exo-alpha-sialidase [Hahella sp. CR1]